MRGRRLLAHHGAGQRVLDVAAAGLAHQRLERGVEAPVDRLVLGAGPGERDPIVLQHQAPRGRVVRHGKERLQARERPLVDAGDQALERAQQPAVGDEQRRQDRRQRRGQHAFLDGQAVGEVLLVDDLDLAGDAGADVEALDLCRVADADGIDGELGAVAEGDDVAVGREAFAQPVGKGQALLARAQQDLGRAQRAGSQHDHVRRHRAGLAAPLATASWRSKWTRQPPSGALATWRTLAWVKISAPCRAASGR